MSVRLPGQLRSAPWIALLPLAAGCVTSALWGIEPDESFALESTRRVEAEVEVRGEPERRTLVAEPTGAAALTGERWRLVPVRGAAEAWAVLASTDRFAIERIDAAIRRQAIDRDLDFRAELDVTARWTGAPIATRIAASDLPAGFAAAVRPLGPHDLLDRDPSADRADLLVRCARRLRAIDAREWLAPAGGSGRLLGCAWLDENGDLLDGATRARLLRDLAMDAPFAGHLALLRRLRLVAVVAPDGRDSGRGREYFVLQPDLVWLRGSLDVEPGSDRVRHRSEWLVYREAARPTDGAALLGRGTLVFDEVTGRTEYAVAQNLATKIALTPVTVAIDAVWIVLRSWIAWPWVREERGDGRRHR